MMNKHAKSPCCRASIRRFGARRRQCLKCKATWRIRQKKRGRKRKSVNPELIVRYLKKELPSLRSIAKQRNCGKSIIQIKLSRSLNKFIFKHRNDWQISLAGQYALIAIADAIWYRVKDQRYTIYIILLRPTDSDKAVICPPLIVAGHEGVIGWHLAMESLPQQLKDRIVALVCDGAGSLIAVARNYNWTIQRCHFHLISAVQNYLTTGPRSTHQEYAIYVLKTVQKLLNTSDRKRIKSIIKELNKICRHSNSRGLRKVLLGLMTNCGDYHAYLNFPKLHLPSTTNSAESFVQCIRDLMYRCRGFRSLVSLNHWLQGLSVFKRTIRCNGKNQPN